jgi:iron complex outermembrane recepter protein
MLHDFPKTNPTTEEPFMTTKSFVAPATLLLATLGTAPVLAEDAPAPAQVLDEVSVTATREARATKDVPQSIAVIGQQRIDDSKMQNIKDVIQGTPGVLIDSKNGGYDARLIIRGAGLKAPYGIREIMVLRDGVPMTDPDSFTRLDFIDTQDIERIEITKGPGSLFSTGSAGGTIQIISKSVFAENANRVRVGAGNEGARSYNVRAGTKIGESQAMAVTASRRESSNDWRIWNEFDTTQIGIKHGVQLDNHTAWESEISYSEANLQLPGAMSAAQFEEFQRTGEQTGTKEAWKNSGRYSKIWFFNTKYEQQFGDVTFKPRVYFNQWKHYHPVTGLINESGDWTQIFGTDLEAHYNHSVAGQPAKLITGVTMRQDSTDDSRKYTYRDVTTGGGGRITATLSDEKGQLAGVSNNTNRIIGLFAQETLHPSASWLIDAGFRLDRSKFDLDENEIIKYNYSTGRYEAGAGQSATNRTYQLFAPKLGASYKLTEQVNVYASAARADQIPSESEIGSNPDLEAATSTNYEVGMKGRLAAWSFDAAYYVNPVKNEIVSVYENTETIYVNAGKTDRRGYELSGAHNLTERFQVGLNYSCADYDFVNFNEVISNVNYDRSGKQVPFVPRQQYGAFMNYRHPAGFKFNAQSISWGKYFVDNANSATYDGFRWVTSVGIGYELGQHSLSLNVDNVTDKHYAMEVKKDSNGTLAYSAATPRQWMLNYNFKF